MEKTEHIANHWNSCNECNGQGKKSRRIRKKNKLLYKKQLEVFNKSNKKENPPTPPVRSLYTCPNCNGTGLIASKNITEPNNNYPHVAIVGGGIGGTALAVACLHRGIPFTLYERDKSFNERTQGYGLTLQQASNAINWFGISSLKNGVVSTRHLVHTTEGKVIGEWGMRKWGQTQKNKPPKRTNIHISRQSLRKELLKQLHESKNIKWGYKLTHLKEIEHNKVQLQFDVNNEKKAVTTDLLVGADGIRSSVRSFIINENEAPLQYLNCIVILGICPLEKITNIKSDLLDSATVFQTVNGKDRIYIMPYDNKSVMWQLSYPIPENEAKELSKKGAAALKIAAKKKTPWHCPVPEIIKATPENKISGYPVYDRPLLHEEKLKKSNAITLIGDAAHPMSPFKGQGANQALLDAIALAKGITKGCKEFSNWKNVGIRQRVLNQFEIEMLKRSANKVKDSAAAAKFLHSETVLKVQNAPRGSGLKK